MKARPSTLPAANEPPATIAARAGSTWQNREPHALPARQAPAQRPNAFWLSPAQRALRNHPAESIAPPKRLPFAGRSDPLANRSEAGRPGGRIFRFTGSNTPYESHE